MRITSEARRLITHFIDPATVSELDLETLDLTTDTILDENLAQYYTDVVYQCHTQPDTDTRVCFLFEHKSYPDRDVLLQILYYQVAKYWKQTSEKEKLELVIPIIITHGERNFKVTPLSKLFSLKESSLQKYLPIFAYELIDINALTEEQLRPLRATYLLSMLLTFKNNGDKTLLLTNIAEIFKFVEAHNNPALEKILVVAVTTYLLTVYQLNKEDMDNIAPRIPEPVVARFLEEGDGFWARGRKEGIKEGIEEGLKEGKRLQNIGDNLKFVVNLLLETPELSDKQRAKLASVDVGFVAQVRKTFTRRSIKKRKTDFRLFYKDITNLRKKQYQEIDQLFEELRKKIKSSKNKLTAKEK